MSTYEPGTVAVATVRGIPNVRVFRFRDVYGRPRWDAAEAIDRLVTWPDEHVTDVRPLVVLDLGNNVESFLIDLRHGLGGDLANDIADQIEAQAKSPRIPEPGLWGVVEAHVGPDGRYRFVRAYDADWLCTASGEVHAWAELIDPVLIRDGIEDAS